MKLYKSLLILSMVAVAGLFTACDDEGYWDKYHFENDTYAFEHKSASYSLKGNDTLPEVKVTLTRGTTKGNADIPTIVTTNSDIITVADTVAHFVDGSSTAEITIKIDEKNIVIGKNYKASVTLDVEENQLSISGATTYTLSFVKDYNWVIAGAGIWASSWTGEQFGVQFEIAEGYNGDGYYCRVAPYKAGNYIPFYIDADGNAVECPAGNYATGISGLTFHHDPAGKYGQYCVFQNQSNIYLLAGVWDSADGLYVAKEQFMWSENWPGEK